MKILKYALSVSLIGLLTVIACDNQGPVEEQVPKVQQPGESEDPKNDRGVSPYAGPIEQGMSGPAEDQPDSGKKVIQAVAVLHSTQGNNAAGVVHFTLEEEGVRVKGEFTGLKPGNHGFHIHELGDCTAADATSAGGHYNPMDKPHGAPDDEERHAGDLGNITADEKGGAKYDRVDSHLSLNGTHSIIGRAVILHSGEDDFVSQPTGNAGSRVACGVIGIAKE